MLKVVIPVREVRYGNAPGQVRTSFLFLDLNVANIGKRSWLVAASYELVYTEHVRNDSATCQIRQQVVCQIHWRCLFGFSSFDVGEKMFSFLRSSRR